MPDKPRYKRPTEERLTKSALHYLDRYASSSANLRKILERKVLKACRSLELDPLEFSAIVDLVVEKCLKAGLLNDLTYAETKTASLKRRGGSRRKIAAQLSVKGVGRDIIQSVLPDDEDEQAAAQVFARRRRLGPFRKSPNRAERRDKDLAAMCRAGFSFEIARHVIDAETDAIGETSQPDPLDRESSS